MTPAELDAIEARLKAATPGRWTVEGLRVMRGTTAVCTLPLNYNGPAPADARFIAHAPADIAALLAEVRRLDAAEQHGFDRAVNSTAIASVHKAVAAERAAIVAWLRAEAERCASACSRGSHDAGIGMVVLRARADFIERGEHHPKETKP